MPLTTFLATLTQLIMERYPQGFTLSLYDSDLSIGVIYKHTPYAFRHQLDTLYIQSSKEHATGYLSTLLDALP